MKIRMRLAGWVVLVLLFAPFGVGMAADWDHVHLVADDTAAAAQWYADHFGGETTKAGPFDAVLFGPNLVKFKKGGESVQGSAGSAVDHIAFSVENVKAKVEELKEAGLDTGAPNRKTQSVALVTDPWGTKIELLKDEDLGGFHHIHLKSPDPQATAEWYAAAFGGEIESYKNIPNLKAIRFGGMWVLIQSAVREVASTKDRSVDHLGWAFNDFDDIVERLKSNGVKFIVPPTESGGHMLAFVEGPDGVKIEIVESTTE